MKQATLQVFLAGAVVIASTTHAEVIDIAWDGKGEFGKSVEVPAGGFAELCGKLAGGQRIQWQFTGKTPMDFNIHYHVGEKVEFPAQQDGIAASNGVLETHESQDYCWMWRNRSKEVVKVEVALKTR